MNLSSCVCCALTKPTNGPENLPKPIHRSPRLILDLQSNLAPSMGSECFAKELARAAKHHAYLRVQLLVVKVIAYYRTGLTVTRGRTRFQIGVGGNGFEAAHAAFISNPHDNWMEAMTGLIKEQRSPQQLQLLKSIKTPPDVIQRLMKQQGEIQASDLFGHLHSDRQAHLINRGTHVYYVLASTNVLPSIVNRCDSVLEAELMDDAIQAINKVAKSLLTPHIAVSTFCQRLQSVAEEAMRELRVLLEDYARVYKASLALDTKRQRWQQNASHQRAVDYILALQKFESGLSSCRSHTKITKALSIPTSIPAQYTSKSIFSRLAFALHAQVAKADTEALQSLKEQLTPWMPSIEVLPPISHPTTEADISCLAEILEIDAEIFGFDVESLFDEEPIPPLSDDETLRKTLHRTIRGRIREIWIEDKNQKLTEELAYPVKADEWKQHLKRVGEAALIFKAQKEGSVPPPDLQNKKAAELKALQLTILQQSYNFAW